MGWDTGMEVARRMPGEEDMSRRVEVVRDGRDAMIARLSGWPASRLRESNLIRLTKTLRATPGSHVTTARSRL